MIGQCSSEQSFRCRSAAARGRHADPCLEPVGCNLNFYLAVLAFGNKVFLRFFQLAHFSRKQPDGFFLKNPSVASLAADPLLNLTDGDAGGKVLAGLGDYKQQIVVGTFSDELDRGMCRCTGTHLIFRIRIQLPDEILRFFRSVGVAHRTFH